MNQLLDCVVIGTGGMGSAALYYAARRGWTVAGLDRFPPGHDRGSSHGQTRIIRQAYFEHPDYVPLVLDAYRMWEEISRASGQSLLEQTGLLQVGKPEGPIIGGILNSAQQHQLHVESLKADQLARRYPMFRFQPETVGLLEPVAGFLRVERCVQALIELAIDQGARVLDGQTVLGWQTAGDGTHLVKTDQAEFHTRRLIVTAGPWTSELTGGTGPECRVIAKHQHWFQIDDSRMTLAAGCPVFFFETERGFFYGFPDFDGHGNKLAEHSGGTDVTDPLLPDRELDAQDLSRLQEFVSDHIACDRTTHIEHSLCMYTMSPDEHFIIDTLDQSGTISIACGLSGHGFKFAPVIGKALVDMLEGQRRADMAFLRLDRFAKHDRDSAIRSSVDDGLRQSAD